MKKLLLTLLLILAFVCNANAIVAWRNGTGENTILGSESASDIDSASYNNIVKPLDTMLSNYRRGCQISYASASTLTVAAGEIMLSNSDGSIRLMQKNTSATTVAWANIDTGAEASSTSYYLWAYMDTVSTTTFSVCISTSSIAPTGKTYYARLGSFYNDASGNITLIANDEPEEAAVYDSGWFAVALATSYTKSHSLGTTKLAYSVWYSASSDGSNAEAVDANYAGYNSGCFIRVLSATSVTITTGNTNIHYGMDGSSAATAHTSGYCRIILVSLE